MNPKQRRVMWAAIALLFLALLVPPWERASDGAFRGYAFLFSGETRGVNEAPSLIERTPGLRICVSFMLLEALFIALAAAGAMTALKRTTTDRLIDSPHRESESQQKRFPGKSEWSDPSLFGELSDLLQLLKKRKKSERNRFGQRPKPGPSVGVSAGSAVDLAVGNTQGDGLSRGAPEPSSPTSDPALKRRKVALACLNGDQALLARLLNYERGRQPFATETDHLDSIIESLERDRR